MADSSMSSSSPPEARNASRNMRSDTQRSPPNSRLTRPGSRAAGKLAAAITPSTGTPSASSRRASATAGAEPTQWP
ncbi:hypothetical protein ACFQ0B_44270 [Nonomuraea thailandensis]